MGYRGEITVVYKITTDTIPSIYREGERFAQLVIVPIPDITVVEATELSETDRGEGGFGSTGNSSAVNDTQDSSDEKVATVSPDTTQAAGDISAPEQA